LPRAALPRACRRSVFGLAPAPAAVAVVEPPRARTPLKAAQARRGGPAAVQNASG
jgi:hypothetical protein